jgi:hypothetical protein
MNTGEIESNFKGVVLGDAWISPLESTVSWSDYLLQTVCLLDFVSLNFITL